MEIQLLRGVEKEQYTRCTLTQWSNLSFAHAHSSWLAAILDYERGDVGDGNIIIVFTNKIWYQQEWNYMLVFLPMRSVYIQHVFIISLMYGQMTLQL